MFMLQHSWDPSLAFMFPKVLQILNSSALHQQQITGLIHKTVQGYTADTTTLSYFIDLQMEAL